MRHTYKDTNGDRSLLMNMTVIVGHYIKRTVIDGSGWYLLMAIPTECQHYANPGTAVTGKTQGEQL